MSQIPKNGLFHLYLNISSNGAKWVWCVWAGQRPVFNWMRLLTMSCVSKERGRAKELLCNEIPDQSCVEDAGANKCSCSRCEGATGDVEEI